jgi:hypothetical protein
MRKRQISCCLELGRKADELIEVDAMAKIGVDEVMLDSVVGDGDQEKLSSHLVDKVVAEREKEFRMGVCQNKKTKKKEQWELILVERQRRRHGNGGEYVAEGYAAQAKENSRAY